MMPETGPIIKESGTFPVVTHRPAWAWRCRECGWLGTGLSSDRAAMKEASNHYWEDHGIAICADIDGEKQLGHPGHKFHRVPGAESTEQCERCGTHVGK